MLKIQSTLFKLIVGVLLMQNSALGALLVLKPGEKLVVSKTGKVIVPDLEGRKDQVVEVGNKIDGLEWDEKQQKLIPVEGKEQPNMIFLGDILDRGESQFALVDGVSDLIDQGKADLISGNRDIKVINMIIDFPLLENLKHGKYRQWLIKNYSSFPNAIQNLDLNNIADIEEQNRILQSVNTTYNKVKFYTEYQGSRDALKFYKLELTKNLNNSIQKAESENKNIVEIYPGHSVTLKVIERKIKILEETIRVLNEEQVASDGLLHFQDGTNITPEAKNRGLEVSNKKLLAFQRLLNESKSKNLSMVQIRKPWTMSLDEAKKFIFTDEKIGELYWRECLPGGKIWEMNRKAKIGIKDVANFAFFMHGFLTRFNYNTIPGVPQAIKDLEEYFKLSTQFVHDQLDLIESQINRSGGVNYQAKSSIGIYTDAFYNPDTGTVLPNDQSPIYGERSKEGGQMRAIAEELMQLHVAQENMHFNIMGHTPAGQFGQVLRNRVYKYISAVLDTSWQDLGKKFVSVLDNGTLIMLGRISIGENEYDMDVRVNPFVRSKVGLVLWGPKTEILADGSPNPDSLHNYTIIGYLTKPTKNGQKNKITKYVLFKYNGYNLDYKLISPRTLKERLAKGSLEVFKKEDLKSLRESEEKELSKAKNYFEIKQIQNKYKKLYLSHLEQMKKINPTLVISDAVFHNPEGLTEEFERNIKDLDISLKSKYPNSEANLSTATLIENLNRENKKVLSVFGGSAYMLDNASLPDGGEAQLNKNLMELFRVFDNKSNRFFVTDGATHVGVEALEQDIMKEIGVPVHGFIPTYTGRGDEVYTGLQSYTKVNGDWNLVPKEHLSVTKATGGVALFISGGGVIRDAIIQAIKTGTPFLLYKGNGGFSEHFARAFSGERSSDPNFPNDSKLKAGIDVAIDYINKNNLWAHADLIKSRIVTNAEELSDKLTELGFESVLKPKQNNKIIELSKEVKKKAIPITSSKQCLHLFN